MREMLKRRGVPAVCILALAALNAGCGKDGQQPVYPVTGEVLFDGKPTPHAQVVLHPMNGTGIGEAIRPRGRVDTQGRFTLSTYSDGDGAPAGDYAVTVEWWLSPASTSKRAGAEDLPPVNHLPKRYGAVQTSGLRVRIEPGSNELPTIRLKK